MKINRIDTFLIDAKSCNWLIAKITTDEDITGIGEESFEVTDFKSRNTTTIAYKDVQHIEAKTLSRGGARSHCGLELALACSPGGYSCCRACRRQLKPRSQSLALAACVR
ncbi:MAG: hypothetical protein EXQ58_00375 [Acidobacteria bacterium]|nr:hypothetical protein [Acidobacteriota bacterium]